MSKADIARLGPLNCAVARREVELVQGAQVSAEHAYIIPAVNSQQRCKVMFIAEAGAPSIAPVRIRSVCAMFLERLHGTLANVFRPPL